MNISALNEIIRQKITAEGPVSIADYMDICLMHPQHGYYMTRDPFGAAGDFTTAPEMTQAFGELIGLWAVETWKAIGSPERFTLCELGPGRGTLMADALRAASLDPAFMKAGHLHLLEASPILRQKQHQLLSQYNPVWVNTPTELPEQPVIYIANEFFDALPVRQFQRVKDEWRERRVALNAQGNFAIVVMPAIDGPNFEMEDESVIETSPAAIELASAMARPAVKHGGAGLIIDYGDDEVVGDTLQAVSNHRQAHLLTTTGLADITAHVSFMPLGNAIRKIGCRVQGPITQGEFLSNLGIHERTAQLLKNASEAQQRSLSAAMHRLTDPSGMGSLFKVMSFADKNSAPPPGFN